MEESEEMIIEAGVWLLLREYIWAGSSNLGRTKPNLVRV